MPLKEKYNNFLLEDFIHDEDFITWVKYGHEDVDNWVSNNPDKSSIVKEAKLLVEALGSAIQQDHTKVKTTLWNRIDQSTSKSIEKGKVRSLRWLIPSLAAACALFFFFTTILGDTSIEVNTGKLEQENITLPDNSTILTNEVSSVSYDKKGYKKNRVIQLDGEAFFEVEKGATFVVKTPLGSVTVLGTSFNVIARDNRFEVECFTGKVEVKNSQGDQVILTPGEKAVQKAQRLEEVQIKYQSQQPKWLAPKKVYKETPLKTVSKDLEEQYPFAVDIAQEVESLPISGQITFANLDETLRTITWPLKLSYTIEKDTIKIYANK